MSENKSKHQQGYKQVASSINEPWDPEKDWDLLHDTCDLHIHATSGRIDAIPLAKQASIAGQKAIILKSFYSLTMEPARMAQQIVCEWAEQRQIRPVKVFGAIALGSLFGGVNPYAVSIAIQFGAKCVWLPTFTAAHHLMNGGMNRDEAMKKGQYLLRGDKLIPEVGEILHMVAEADIILSLGHISGDEMFAVVEAAKTVGIKKMVVDHPHLGSSSVAVDNQKKLAGMGVYLNHVACSFTPLFSGALTIQELADQIRNVGAEHCILSTDTGQNVNAPPADSLRTFIRHLMVCGIEKSEIDVMTKTNPARLLSLDV